MDSQYNKGSRKRGSSSFVSRSFRRHENLPGGMHRLWKIHSGLVRTLTWDADGYIMPLGFWGPGSIVGTPLVRVRPFEIQCMTKVAAEQMSALQPLPQSVILAQTHQSMELLRILHHRQTDVRLLQFLCWLVREFGEEASEGRCLPLKVTHQEIADAISSTRVTVTRFLKQFDLEGRLHWSGKKRIIYQQTLDGQKSPIFQEKIA